MALRWRSGSDVSNLPARSIILPTQITMITNAMANRAAPANESSGSAVASMVLGIISLVIFPGGD
ncbi:MAG: hypothetical protein EXS16_10915 [Gemmataceae bacterium]|nr:hypothetical protein [Gemmataceae bacterium]